MRTSCATYEGHGRAISHLRHNHADLKQLQMAHMANAESDLTANFDNH